MPRRPQINYWPSRGGFCCWILGKQELLAAGPDDRPDGPTYRAAQLRFNELLYGAPDVPTLNEVVQQYLLWAEQHREASTVSIRRQRLSAICAAMGWMPIEQITVHRVESWCDEQVKKEEWSSVTVRMTLSSISACLRWAARRGLIAKNPLGPLEYPEEVSRGLECVLSPDEETKALAACSPRLRDLAQVLRDTGARPGEIAAAEAKHYNPSIRALVFEARVRPGEAKHKTARSGKPRVIYLRGESVQIVERLCKLYPSGPLFRTSVLRKKGPHAGKRWSWYRGSISRAFTDIRKRTGIKGLIAYSFRHTFAVRWLRAGKPVEPLAEILGTSVNMIRRHYGHLADQHDYLRRLADEFQG